jgi:hypothetical protein
MRRRILSGLVALGALAGDGWAGCSCTVPEPWFLGRLRHGEVVVLADVAGQSGLTEGGLPTLLDLDVREVLKGAEKRTRLRVLGESDGGCRSKITTFKPGSRWIFVLTALGQAEEWVRSGAEYELEGCGGVWWARVEGDTVSGLFSARDLRQGKPSRRPLAEVRALLRP